MRDANASDLRAIGGNLEEKDEEYQKQWIGTYPSHPGMQRFQNRKYRIQSVLS
jgi:hypothetical protein